MIKPSYYQDGTGKDLLNHLAEILPAAQYRGFCKGNAVKYLVRYEDKNGVEDLDKALTYLERLKEFEGQQARADKAAKIRAKFKDKADKLRAAGIDPEIKSMTVYARDLSVGEVNG
ncbi:MAG: DUF3310 domain-containing protein [Lactobacillus sp.]|jgi:hypothetical protein|nr:DUF3310 domain-containing protein [Lactobacillus sp.]